MRDHRAFLGIAVLFLAVRLWNIGRLDVVHDESMYMSWARAIASDPKWAFLPQMDGKTPLYYWLASAWPGLARDPLAACRQVSVFSGLAALVAVYGLGWRFFGKRTGILAAFLYVFSPFPMFLERMALVDALLSALGCWTLLALLETISGRVPFRKGLAACAVLAGLGYLAKPPAFLWIVSAGLIAGWVWRRGSPYAVMRRLAAAGAILAGILAGVWLCLSSDLPNYYAQRDRIFVHPPFKGHYWLTVEAILRLPFPIWGANLREIAGYLVRYMPWTFLAPLAAGAFGAGPAGQSILVWAIIPMAVVGGVLGDPHSRFVLFAAAPLVVLAARGVLSIGERLGDAARYGLSPGPGRAAWILAVLCAVPGMLFAWNLANAPDRADWTGKDRVDYVVGELAGDGLGEAVRWIEANARANGPLDLFVYHRWGVPTDVMEAHFRTDPAVRVWMVHWGDRILDGHPEQMLVIKNQYTHEMAPLDFSAITRAWLMIRRDYASEEDLRRLNPGAEPVKSFGRFVDGTERFVLWKLR